MPETPNAESVHQKYKPWSSIRTAKKGRLRLAELRSIGAKTQTEVAEVMGTTQSGVARIERQHDLLVSTLDAYVKATGGELHLMARYPNGTEVEVAPPHLAAPSCPSHKPVQHRDGKSPWCKTCGLTATFEEPAPIDGSGATDA